MKKTITQIKQDRIKKLERNIKKWQKIVNALETGGKDASLYKDLIIDTIIEITRLQQAG